MAQPAVHGRIREIISELAKPYRAPEARAASSSPFLHQPLSTAGLLACFVFASLPAWAVGIWNTGRIIIAGRAATEADGWPLALLGKLGIDADPTAALACVTIGLVHFIPLFVAVIATSAFWALVFAKIRQRGVDPGWLVSAWLLVLLVPPSTTLVLACVATSFGMVLGSHIFGGTGKHLVSPALLGILFLHFSYPELARAPSGVDGLTGADGWTVLASGAGGDVLGFFLGREPGGLATGSALACAAGALYLVRVGAASWRTIAGAVLGFLIAAGATNAVASEDPAWGVPWYAHLAVGYVAFGVAFLGTDPSAAPLTRPARWVHGLLIGVLTVVIRVLDPSHPEGSLYALLLAGLSVPFLDYVVVRKHRTGTRTRGL